MTRASEEPHGGKIVVRIEAELEELIPGFLENRQTDLKALRKALAVSDYESVRILGHGMKGSGGGYGFDEITALGRVLEEAGKNQSGAAIKQAMDDLAIYLDRLEIVYY